MFIFLLTAVSAKTQTTLDVGSKSFLKEGHNHHSLHTESTQKCANIVDHEKNGEKKTNPETCECGNRTCGPNQYCDPKYRTSYTSGDELGRCTDEIPCEYGFNCPEKCDEDTKVCVGWIKTEPEPCLSTDGQEKTSSSCKCSRSTCAPDEFCDESKLWSKCSSTKSTPAIPECPNTDGKKKNDAECRCASSTCSANEFCNASKPAGFFGLTQRACSATQFCESSLDCPDGTCPAGFCVPKASQESGRKDKEFCGERNISECHDDLIRKYCPDLCKDSSIENLRANEVEDMVVIDDMGLTKK